MARNRIVPIGPRRITARRIGAALTVGAVTAALAVPGAGAQDFEAAVAGPSDWQLQPAADNFNRVGVRVVGDGAETSAPEIVDTYANGTMAIFTDATAGDVGYFDITDPTAPGEISRLTLPAGSDPTSVAIYESGGIEYAVIGNNTTTDLDTPSGELRIFNMSNTPPTESGSSPIALGGQPDAIDVSPSGNHIAVVIENERDEDEVVGGQEGALPQAPSGFLLDIETGGGAPATWAAPTTIALNGLTVGNQPTDAEPEYVDINTNDIAVVSLQENNSLAIFDLSDDSLVLEMDAGTVSLPNVDITEDDIIDFNGSIIRERQPDTVQWLSPQYFATANEGDIPANAGTEGGDDGGSRGFTIFDTSGNVVFESGEAFEYAVASVGHFPLGRAENKGNEPEALEFGTFDGTPYLFVGSERGGVVGVYDVTNPAAPILRQLLPAGIGPEGLKAVPSRNLLLVANETDENYPSSVMIFQRQEDTAATYPTLVSGPDGANRWPIPWAAQSALAAHPTDPDVAYSVSDSFLADSSIYQLDLTTTPPTITDKIELSATGVDPEGLAVYLNDSGQLEFWVATEGNPTNARRNQIHQVSADGTILASYGLPAAMLGCWIGDGTDNSMRFGFEGVAVDGNGDVWVAQQREWTAFTGTFEGTDCTQFNDTAGETALWKIEIPESGTEATFTKYPYTLDDPAAAGGWVGLSEIVAYGPGQFLVVERDNQLGPNAEVKRVYAVTVPAEAGPVTKGTVLDLLPTMQARNGIVLDKVEGAMVTTGGDLWVSTDNDGVDDASGESLLLNLGPALGALQTDVAGSWLVSNDGMVTAFGSAPNLGTDLGLAEGVTVVDFEANATGTGAWVLLSDGSIVALGEAAAVGPVATAGFAPGESLAAIVPRPQGDGAWVITDRGRVIALGAAPLVAGVENLTLQAPIVDAASTTDGTGIYLTAPDGGVFALGTAIFYGSTGDIDLNSPVVTIAVDPDGTGYWFFAADGGVFAYEATFTDSLPGLGVELNSPIFTGQAYGDGYILAATDGGIFNFSNSPFTGSLGENPPASGIAGFAAFAL